MTVVRVEVNSNDRKYYTQVQRIVWAKCRNPYDLSLWIAIKNIAGDKGVCILSREDLAALSMISTGQVSRSAKYLMSVGFLRGKFYRDPGYAQKVWHFRIPDVWRENIEWAQEHSSIPDQTKWKKEWRKMHKDAGKFTEQPSPDDEEPSPGDPGMIWSDTKNNSASPSAGIPCEQADARCEGQRAAQPAPRRLRLRHEQPEHGARVARRNRAEAWILQIS